jgi:tetratricopeptide (TPR) repeat protein/transcriptional regulator with XRE-family HTH domain
MNEVKAARRLGMRPAQLSELERKEEGALTRDSLEELLALLDIPPEAIDPALYALDIVSPPQPSGSPVDPTPAERRSLQQAAIVAGNAALEATREKLTANLRQVKVTRARRQAASLWKTLEDLPPRRRRSAVEAEHRYWTWALAERLCEESVRAAAHRADGAMELANLALRVAELAPGSEPWRSRLLGWVWAFVANALRVHGDLPGAEEGFVQSDRLLEAGAAADANLLDRARPLGLKATLRRYQGRYDEALALLEQALKVSASNEARGRILVKTANTLELRGDSEQAISELLQAQVLLEESRDARLAWTVRYTLAVNLWQLGRYEKAEALLPEVRKSAIGMGNELDLIRTLWLEGGISAGLGRLEMALAALEQARRYFNDKRIVFDAALVSLELAIFYMKTQNTAEVKRLTDELVWIFKAQGVHKEALAALRLFYEASRKEEVTDELIRSLIEYLRKVRCQPNLRFEVC